MSAYLILTIFCFVFSLGAAIFGYSKYAKGKVRLAALAVAGASYLGLFIFSLLWGKKSFAPYPETLGYILGVIASVCLFYLCFLATPLVLKLYVRPKSKLYLCGAILLSWLLFSIFSCLWAGKAYQDADPGVAIGAALCLSFFILGCSFLYYVKDYGSMPTWILLGMILICGFVFILLAVKESRVILGNEKETMTASLNYLKLLIK